jgi:DNA invertase Pin-like site-specific DNA recombinase
MILDLYARVSTEDQNVKQQMQHLKEWAKRNEYTVRKVVMDTESGTKPLIERKRFLRLLDESKDGGANGMAIVNLDRLTRNWEDVVFIEKFFSNNWNRYKLLSIGDTIDLSNASGRFTFRVRMAMCCYMPEDMREKQRIGIERAKKEKKYKGRKKGSKNKI